MPDVLARPDSIRSRADVLSPAFVCSWTDGGRDAAWVHVDGELDVATVPELERTLDRPDLRARLVVLDLRELAFIDSSGVNAIVDASVSAREGGRRLVLLRGPPNVDRIFMLTGSLSELTVGDLHPWEPSVRALLQLAEDELASSVPTAFQAAAETASNTLLEAPGDAKYGVADLTGRLVYATETPSISCPPSVLWEGPYRGSEIAMAMFQKDKVEEKEPAKGSEGWYADPYGDGARRWYDAARGWTDRVEGEGQEPDKTGVPRLDEAAESSDDSGDDVDADGKPARLSRPVDPGMLGRA